MAFRFPFIYKKEKGNLIIGMPESKWVHYSLKVPAEWFEPRSGRFLEKMYFTPSTLLENPWMDEQWKLTVHRFVRVRYN